jgi:uncharacterized low-complexity protein
LKHLTKVLLIVVALVGLTVGMSTITGCSSSSDDTKAAVSNKADEAKASVDEAKCGEGKCGGNSTEIAVSDKVYGAKCGGDEAKVAVSEKVDEAKCGEGKCG